LLDQANAVMLDLCALNPELEDKINATAERIRARQEGTPLTEFLEPENQLMDKPGSQQNALAHKLLLTKAWRRIRSMVHPDKGHEEREEFQVLKAAYEAGDLNALTEYAIAREKTIVEQIEHWQNEVQRPAVNWQILQQMPMFKAVQAFHAGKRDQAAQLALQLRLQRLRELELEELMMG
jgi:hypothetical protein